MNTGCQYNLAYLAWLVHILSRDIRPTYVACATSPPVPIQASVENISRLVNDEGSEMLVAVASAAGTWTDSVVHQPG